MARTGHNRNGHGHGQTHVTETPDVSHIKNIDVTHEASDVSVSGILKFVVGLTIFGAIVSVLMWGLFIFLNAQEEKKEPQPGPMAMSEKERLPPPPRLQAAPGFGVTLESGEWVKLEKREPEAEFRVLREQWERKLNCKEPTSKDHAATTGNSPGDPAVQTTDHAASKEVAKHAPCIPIEDAIQKLLEKGLPSRSASATPDDIALPTAASSGRVTGGRGQ
jgi:hypothetical protein